MACTGPYQKCRQKVGQGTPGEMATAEPGNGTMRRDFTPNRNYFERNIEPVTPDMLRGMVESSSFSRQDGMTILNAVRENAVEKLSRRVYSDSEALDRAVTAINANVIKHSAQVMVLTTRLAAAVQADPATARQAALGAGYHDSDKDDTNFVYHHLDSANFAVKSLHETGLSNDESEIASIRQDIMSHMPFGDGDDPGNFMNKMLAGEAATIVQAESDFRPRLRYLMKEALQKSDEDIARVEAWVEANAQNYKTKNELSEAMSQEFGGKELSYPKPSGQAAEILHNAAVSSGEHLLETRKGDDGRSLSEAYHASQLVWMADGLSLSSAESLPKIVAIHQIQWGRTDEPIAVSMSSLIGGFGQPGTAVGAANALTLPLARESAMIELGLMREFRDIWQQQTLKRWAAGPPPRPESEVDAKRQALEESPFTAFTNREMLDYQPGMDEFMKQYPAFLNRNKDRRGELLMP